MANNKTSQFNREANAIAKPSDLDDLDYIKIIVQRNPFLRGLVTIAQNEFYDTINKKPPKVD